MGEKFFSLNTSYINLAPYQKMVPQNLDWNKPVQSLSGESIFRYKFKMEFLNFIVHLIILPSI